MGAAGVLFGLLQVYWYVIIIMRYLAVEHYVLSI